MAFVIEKAIRSQFKLKMGLSSASGFGKTYSGLLLAKGYCGDLSKVCVIDTENKSSSLYSDLGDFSIIRLDAPYSPERYIEAIETAESNGFELIMIDSISHEWEGKGGCLEIHTKLGGQFNHWAKVTPRHQAFIDKIINSKCNIITTVRRKQDYDMVKNSSGKTEPVKVGTKEQTREGFEYELTINLEIINSNHLVRSSKDRTKLFDGQPEFIITEETGYKIRKWIESGAVLIEDKQVQQAMPDPLEARVEKMFKYLEDRGVTEAGILKSVNKIHCSFIDDEDLDKIKFIIQGAKDLASAANEDYMAVLRLQFPEPVTITAQAENVDFIMDINPNEANADDLK